VIIISKLIKVAVWMLSMPFCVEVVHVPSTSTATKDPQKGMVSHMPHSAAQCCAFEVGDTAAVVDGAEQHQGWWATAGLDPERCRHLLQVRRREVELPQSLACSAWNRRAGGGRPRRSSSSPQCRK